MLGKRMAPIIRHGLTLVCIGVSFAVCLLVGGIIQSRGEQAFVTVTNDSLSALKSRIGSYEQSLDGLYGFLDASDEVNAKDWHHIVSALKVKEKLPGLKGLCYVVLADASEAARIQTEQRLLGSPDFVIHPETGRDQKLIVTFVAPAENNVKIPGLDIAFEESRRVAAMESRASGQTRATPPVDLFNDDGAVPGFLVLRPYFQRDMPTATLAERQQAFRGWICASVDVHRLLDELTEGQGELFNIKVSDQDSAADKRVFYDRPTPASGDMAGTFFRRSYLSVYGRTWVVEWRSTPAFDLNQNPYAKWLFLIAGLIISLLIYLYMRSTSERHRLVTREVEIKTREMTELIDQNRTILLNAMIGILVLDGEDRILQVNPAAEQLFGRNERVLRNMRLSDLLDSVQFDPTGATGPVKAQSIDGKTIYLDMQRNSWVHTGEARQTVLISDVTEKILANLAMIESERRWNLALMGAKIGVYDIDLTTQTSVVSETWKRVMGHAPGDPDIDFQKNFMARLHPDDLAGLQKVDQECFDGKTERSITDFRMRFPGGWRWMHSDGAVSERDADNRALRFIGALTDVTELRVAQDALARSEERFRLVLANAPVGMAIMDLDGRLTEANAAISTMTGYSYAELADFRFIQLFPEDEVEGLLDQVADLYGNTDKFYSGEHRIIRKDGSSRWGEVKVSCVVDVNQGGEIYIIQINDVTHKREVDRVKGEFIATVSHELRTPLTSIKGALDLVSRTKAFKENAPAARLLEIATSNTERLIILVNDILDMEKISSGKDNFAYQDVSCNRLILNTMNNIRPIAEKKQITMIWDEQAADTMVRVDPVRAGQVLLNLLSNACKFSHQGGTVELGFSILGDMARFSVVDHGEGVPKDFHAMIFDRFSQADSSDTRSKGGTGLGLSICKQIVDRMGGEIGFDSIPGERTDFWFTCPLAMPQLLANMAPIVPKTGEDSRERKRILHLESSADFANLVRADLAKVATVVTVKDETAAHAALSDGLYDVIVLGRSFTEEGGKALLEQIEKHQPQAHVVTLSASRGAEDEQWIRTPSTPTQDLPPKAKKPDGE